MQELESHAARLKAYSADARPIHFGSPNGSHQCLVYELLGPSVPGVCDAKFTGGRLPGKLAKSIAKQSLVVLGELHQLGICHGCKSHRACDVDRSNPSYIHRFIRPQHSLYPALHEQPFRGEIFRDIRGARDRLGAEVRWGKPGI
jgi:serine/threonine protein kinase